MRVLITGANGYLGLHVVKALLTRNIKPTDLRCLVRLRSDSGPLEDLGVEIVRGSLNSYETCESIVADIDCIVHLAASATGSPMGMLHETVVSTELLLKAAKQSGTSRLVFCSSFSVIGTAQLETDTIVDENSPIEEKPAGRDAYAWVKYYQEKWVSEHSSFCETLVLRPSVIYGDGKGMLSSRIGVLLPGLNIFLKVGGSARLPLTHVENCAEAFALAALGGESGLYHIVDDECPMQKDYFRSYEKHAGKVKRKLWLPYPLFLAMAWFFEKLHRISGGNFPAIFTPYKVRSMYRSFDYSNEKAKRELGWQPKPKLEETFQALSYAADG